MELILLACYSAVLLWAARAERVRPEGVCPEKGGSEAAFFVNNRASGAFGVGFSILVSCVGASATLGMIGMAFAVGTPAFWWLGMGAAGLVVLSLVLAQTVRRSGAYTLPHMVETFLGKPSRPLIACVVVVAWLAILAAQFSAIVRVLEPLTGFGPLSSLGIGLFLVLGHTMGGQSAIMRTDRVQAAVLVAALAGILVWLTRANPSWPEAVSIEVVNTAFPPSQFLYFLFVVGANYLVCPMLFGRMLSAKDARSARLGGLIGACGLVLCAGLIVAVGLACKGLIAPDTPQDAVLTAVLTEAMPSWMHVVVFFALLSAIVSSADSCLVTAATVLSFDVFRSRNLLAGRGCIIALGMAGAALSLWGKGILGFLLMAYDVYACGVVMPVFVGIVFHRRRALHSGLACAAIGSGGIFGVCAALSGNALYNYMGMSLSAALALAGVFWGAGSGRASDTQQCR